MVYNVTLLLIIAAAIFSQITQSRESHAAHLFAYRNPTGLLGRIVYCTRGRYMQYASASRVAACDCAIARAQCFYRLVQRLNNDARVLRDLWRIKQKLHKRRGGVFMQREQGELYSRRSLAIAACFESVNNCFALLLLFIYIIFIYLLKNLQNFEKYIYLLKKFLI